MGKKRRKIWKVVKFLAFSAIAFELGTQAAYSVNCISNRTNPSEERKRFHEEFGVRLIGWASEIEGNKKNITEIADILSQEKARHDFTLDSIEVRANSYLKKHIADQAESLLWMNYVNYYSFVTDSISLHNSVRRGVLRHELKHAVAYDIMAKFPEFESRWEALALDENGNSMYYGRLKYLLGMSPKIKPEESEAHGFVTPYAMVNVDEDMAELGEAAEENPNYFIMWLSNGKGRNEKIASKVSLAQEYGFIPKEFSEYVSLLGNIITPMFYMEGRYPEEGIQLFMKQSHAFIEKHPKTVYLADIRARRGYFLQEKGNLKEAISEYEAALNAEVKPMLTYGYTLQKLRACYGEMGDENMEFVYLRAGYEFERRRKEGDSRLAREGVNGLIKELKKIYEK